MCTYVVIDSSKARPNAWTKGHKVPIYHDDSDEIHAECNGMNPAKEGGTNRLGDLWDRY
jgi:hypothetical protein